ncbi:unnamed protein product [Auanema sp. JU1783]|nr:unnamed protein product [Auanema sp. JU1783]
MEQNDDFNAYRAMCANRLRRLERYKKARSFCNLEEDSPSTAQMSDNDHLSTEYFSRTQKENSSPFEMIREKMFALMENDMSLLQQLLSLGDQISEMKENGLRRTQSTNSIDDRTEQDEEDDQFDECTGFSASMSAVTTLYVDDARPQYFSRQNSVLRIPIPPRASNRFGPKRVPRRPSDLMRHPAPARSLHINADDSSSDCSDEAVSPLSHTPSTISGKSNITYSSSNASDLNPASIIMTAAKNRSSNSSIDSGIRESTSSSSCSPSPTFEREVA